MELIVRLKGQCHKHEYEQSEFNRYSKYWENAPVFWKYYIKPRKDYNYFLAGHITVRKVMMKICQTLIRYHGEAKCNTFYYILPVIISFTSIE